MRDSWSSQTGFYLACIGSAIGLGNIWRFPYIVGENGGGAFLVPYVLITLCFGLLFMIVEIAIGRLYQTSVISCMINIGSKFKFGGYGFVVVSFVIVGYYFVILGWVLAFLIFTITGSEMTFDAFTDSWMPVVSFGIVLGITLAFVRNGISKGVELLNKVGIPLLVAMIIPLTIYGMMLPDADKGLSYYLIPDFERILDSSIWMTAFGQVFFSLGIGFGILLTYGSYLKNRESVFKSSLIIVISNAMVSFVVGLMIFSFIFSFGEESAQGVALVFKILPTIFDSMEYGNVIGSVFFLLVLIAGITSAVSITQVSVSALSDQKKISVKKSTYVIGGLLGIFGGMVSLSYASLHLKIFDMPLLDFLDLVVGTYGLMISSVIFITIVLWFADTRKLLDEINIGSRALKISHKTIKVIRFVFPIILIMVMILK